MSPLDTGVAPGEIVLDRVSRSFSMRADQGRTLKGLLLGRRQPEGPPAVHALRDVSLHVQPGETVGLIGRNGAGKSSTLRLLAGIVPPNRGTVRCGGRIVTLLELGSGFSRDFSGRENIYLNGALHGLSKPEIDERLEPIIAFSELGTFIDAPVKTYSSGMFVRLGFAIAAHLEADVLLIDELLAVGDEAFQRKCMRRIAERISEGTTLILVSHAASAIERMCERVVVLDSGRVVFDGPTSDGLPFYHRLMGTEEPEPSRDPRAGAGAFEIAALDVGDDDGRRSYALRAGRPARVTMTLRATRPATAPSVQLEVRDQEGRRLFATEAAPDIDDTPTRLSFEIPRLGLLGGYYEVVLSVRDAAVPDAPPSDRVVGFAVADEPDAEGVVDLRGMWTAAEPAETVR
jgi:ABC-type polysaccharide/polyol phosphate transport system ATPase subunit